MKPIPRLSIATALALVSFAACDAGTSGRLVEVSFVVAGRAEGAQPFGVFTTDTGWSVTLTDAKLVLGGIHAFAPDPAERAALARLFGPSLARAHGGIDPLANRRVRAEWLEPTVFDALAEEPLDLGLVLAESGEIDALEVRLEPPPAAHASETRDSVAYVAGTATRDSVAIDFEGGITVADIGTQRRVESIPVEATLDAGGALSLGLRPATWFRGVHFDRLPSADPITGVTRLVPGSQPYQALFLGIRNPLAYDASYADAMEGTP